MMFIGKSKMDGRGRFTLPRSFRNANNISSDTTIYFIPLKSSNEVKLAFIKSESEEKDEDNVGIGTATTVI
jgi:bifunctional DNA-binding transcriptional regulator/antitoxin component of YhaV-PrlF toxin-antitoxin module|tara:strand:- start:319 stop:531 length:213 start_codon:yes stop_codon:yes gene_type:complete